MNNKKVYLQFVEASYYKNKIWFPNGGFNGLCSIDLKDFSVKYERIIPFLDNQIKWPYLFASCSCGCRMFFFPWNCNNVMVYDMEKDFLIGIPIVLENSSLTYETIDILELEGKIWLIPGQPKKGFFVVDPENLSIQKDLELSNLFKEIDYIYSIIRLNESIIFILIGERTILAVDIKRKRKIFCKNFSENISIWRIKYDGNNIWLLQNRSTDVYEWNMKDDLLIKYQLHDAEWITICDVPYSNIIFLKDTILLLPCRLKYIMKINKGSYTISKAFDYPSGFRFLRNEFSISGWSAFVSYNIVQDKIFLHPVLGNMLLIYDFIHDKIEGKEINISSVSIPFQRHINENLYMKNGIYYESDDIGMESISDILDKKSQYNSDTLSVGKSIYEFLK